MATRAQLFAKPKVDPKYQDTLDYITPYMNQAVKVAEGNPRNFGVLSVDTKDPNAVLNSSIRNNFWRWLQANQPGKFVDFMQQRWAPLGAENDPDNLNANWGTNVRDALKKKLGPEEYNKWKRLNLVMNQSPWGIA